MTTLRDFSDPYPWITERSPVYQEQDNEDNNDNGEDADDAYDTAYRTAPIPRLVWSDIPTQRMQAISCDTRDGRERDEEGKVDIP